MTLDWKLVKEAAEKLWEDYHEKIESLGYTLGKDSFLQAPDSISIVATIRPNYSNEMGDKFRKIIPMEYLYNGEKIPVIISPSINDMFKI